MRDKVAFVAVAFAMLLMGAGCGTVDTDNTTQNQQAVTSEGTVADQAQILTEEPMFEFSGLLPEDQITQKQVRISTEKGDIVFTLFADTAPLTVSNFVNLTQKGYFDGLTFHRREEGFVIQGGDPNGNGTGGPGYTFPDELADDYQYTRGIVAMANRGPNTNGSQFFVMLEDAPLPKAYSIFGVVTEGMDVVDQIAIGDVMSKVSIEDLASEETSSEE